jgi:hypothetical protein
MAKDALEEAAINIQLLITEEMSVQHRLGAHPVPAQDCPLCRR